jgi:PAS domain S-box-containing protein
MKDEKKTKKQLIDELRKLRRRLARWEALKSTGKRAEKALRYSEENFRALVENATDGILIATGKGIYVYANKGAAKITGYSVAELLNLSMKDLTHPDDYKRVAERYRKRLAGKSVPRQYETVIIRKDGQSVPIEITAAKTFWQGESAGLAIMRDITERRKVEEALQESEERFRLAFEDGPLGMAIVGLDYRLLKVNQVFCKMLEYTEHELTSCTFVDITYPEDVEKDSQLAERVFKGEIPSYHMEKRYIKKSGETMWAGLTATVIRDQDGNAVYGLAMIEDITDRKRAGEALRETERRYRTTIDSMSDIVHMVDRDLRVLLINPAFKKWARLLKLDTKIVGRTLFEDFPFLTNKIRTEYRQVFKTGKSLITEERTLIEGKEYITETRKIPIIEKGEVVRVITVIRDFTAQKRAEEALRESEEQYRTLVEESLQGLVITQGFPPRILFANSKAADIIGFSTEEVMALTPEEMMDLVHVEDKEAFQEYFQDPEARESLPAHFEFRIVRKNKIVRWVETFSTNTFYGGEPAVQTAIIDITERKEAERKLREREEYNRHLIHNSSDLIAVVEEDGTIRYLSPSAEQLLGYKPADLIDTSLFEYLHPEDIQRIQTFYDEALKKPGVTPSIEHRLSRADGSWVFVESVGNNLLENPVVEGLIINTRDISERKQNEEELRKYREHLEELVEERTTELHKTNEQLQREIEERKRTGEALRKNEESMRAMLNAPTDSAWVLIDSRGIVLTSNEAAAGRLGKKVDEFLGTVVFDHFPANVAELRKKKFDQVFQSREPVRFEDERAGRILDTSIYPVFDAQGEVTQVAGFSQDITERKEAELRNQMKAELLNKLRDSKTVEDCLQLGCQTIRDAGLFKRAIMTLHNEKREITHFGQVGLNQKVVERACKAPPPDEDLTKKMTQKEFQISHSFLIPKEAALDFQKTGRYLPQKLQQGKEAASWKPGDELFVPIISKDGSTEGFLSVDTPTNGERPKRNTVLYLEEIVDIVARQMREIQNTTQLRQSEKKYRELANLLPQTVFELDLKGNLTFTNRAGVKSFGYTQEDLNKGLNVLKLFIPEDKEKIQLNIGARLQGKSFEDHEYTALRKDDSTFPVLIYSSPIIHDNKPVGLRGIVLDISERKRAEEALQASEEKWRSLVENSPDTILNLDRDGKILFINHTVPGYTLEETIGKTVYDYIPPEQHEKTRKATEEVLKTGSTVNFETSVIGPDGGTLWYSTRLGPINQYDKIVGVAQISTNITERKRMELTQRALHQIANAVHTTKDLDQLFGAIHRELSTVVNTENFFIALLDEKSDLISFPYHKDERDPYVETLPASKTVTGYMIRNDKPLLINGKGIEELAQAGEIEILGVIPKIWLGVLMKAGEELIGALVVQNYENESALSQEDLEILRFVSGQIGLSIERKRAQDALQQSEERFRKLFEQSNDAVFIHTLEGQIQDVNRCSCDMLGYEKDELLSMPISALHPDEVLPASQEAIRITREKGAVRFESKFRKSDGTKIDVDISSRVVDPEQGIVQGIARNITERKRAETELREILEELARSNAELEQFAYIASPSCGDVSGDRIRTLQN